MDRNIEFYTTGFTGLEADPVMTAPVSFVGAFSHSNAATVSNLSISKTLSVECLNSNGNFQNYSTTTTSYFEIKVNTGGVSGDSGGIVLNSQGRVIGIISISTIQNPFTDGTYRIAGPRASKIRSVLGFDNWYGANSIQDNTIGVFRTNTAGWYVDNGNGKLDSCTSAPPTTTTDQCNIFWGNGTDIPITGDWDNANANGVPTNDFTMGAYRPTTDPNAFFLSNRNNPPTVSIWLATGPASFGYKPVTGKWQGNNGASNATSKVGVFRPGTGGWFLDSGNNVVEACGTDYCFFLASGLYQAGDIPIAGDWNNDGIVSIGLFRPGVGGAPDYFFLSNVNPFDVRFNGTIANWNQGTIPGGPGFFGYLPIVGNWTGVPWAGTALDKVGIFRPSTGGWYLDNGNLVFSGCTEDQCPQAFGQSGDRPVAFGKSLVKAN